jgi:hypothetical protein
MNTPQTFTMASPPAQSTGYGVGRRALNGNRALHPGPYPPDLSRLIAYGTSPLVRLLHPPATLTRPGRSGSTRPP